ncbi:hypothetical protein C7B79_06635 [Chroococcidiopsis cubana CCALA 043]|nr:hypothetical protein [Chroococcidiopsis cubana]PSB65155.1 hypothetical protein C7B79_06635 [Chroococcidiopsis cubana CCALA 043]
MAFESPTMNVSKSGQPSQGWLSKVLCLLRPQASPEVTSGEACGRIIRVAQIYIDLSLASWKYTAQERYVFDSMSATLTLDQYRQHKRQRFESWRELSGTQVAARAQRLLFSLENSVFWDKCLINLTMP